MSRRGFLGSARAGLFALGASRNLAWPQNTTQSVLTGTEFDVQIGATPVNITGRAVRSSR
jgi:hypothetical protein